MNDPSLDVVTKIVTYTEALRAIQTIRRLVFQIEQGVAPELEFDGQDHDSKHVLAYIQDQAVGTARIRYLTPHLAKIERMAVLAAHRRQGLGTKIMATALDFLSQQHIPTVKIHA
ncbi:MAG: GNAT family N-acetyltransferase, partial [Cyanothece sp. SIO1E1]|nr:GNAT family N-acetyltransferase [Cyanothece sp. SIO1E1]